MCTTIATGRKNRNASQYRLGTAPLNRRSRTSEYAAAARRTSSGSNGTLARTRTTAWLILLGPPRALARPATGAPSPRLDRLRPTRYLRVTEGVGVRSSARILCFPMANCPTHAHSPRFLRPQRATGADRMDYCGSEEPSRSEYVSARRSIVKAVRRPARLQRPWRVTGISSRRRTRARSLPTLVRRADLRRAAVVLISHRVGRHSLSRRSPDGGVRAPGRGL